MTVVYYNFSSSPATNWVERRLFLAHWWRFYRHDPFWVPPYYPALRQAVEAKHNPHLDRLSALPIHLEALIRRQQSSQDQPLTFGYNLEQPVAASIILTDPRRTDSVAYLALLRVVNSGACLTHLLEGLREPLRSRGVTKLIGPTGLSPHLGAGLLQDYWDTLPPLYTPYNPPYLPEVAGAVMRARSQARLYQFDVPTAAPEQPEAHINLIPFQPERLALDLLPLLQTACFAWLNFPPPDVLEAQFLLRWISHWPLTGWLAQVDHQPVGFILLQPDFAHVLHRAKGGRSPWWRLWLSGASRRPAKAGRILYLAVLPEWQGRGVGRRLLKKAFTVRQKRGWTTLSVGPVPATEPAGQFLVRFGAEAKQAYRLYEWDL